MRTYANCIGLGHLANNFCRSCRDEEEEETFPHWLGTYPTLCQRRRKYLGTYNIDDLEDLSRIEISSINRFIRRSKWSQFFLDGHPFLHTYLLQYYFVCTSIRKILHLVGSFKKIFFKPFGAV